jgi:nitrous oxidase accessory protein NosD
MKRGSVLPAWAAVTIFMGAITGRLYAQDTSDAGLAAWEATHHKTGALITEFKTHAAAWLKPDNIATSDIVTGGTGAKKDPYIIQGWEITNPDGKANRGSAIRISDIRDHYIVIRNCFFHDVATGGVSINGSSHIRMENVTVLMKQGVETCGIGGTGWQDVQIINCRIQFGNNSIHMLDESSDVLIDGNALIDTSKDGMYPAYSATKIPNVHNVQVSNNYIAGHYDNGIDIFGTLPPDEKTTLEFEGRKTNLLILGNTWETFNNDSAIEFNQISKDIQKISDVIIAKNIFKNGNIGIGNDGGTASENHLIVGNVFENISGYGIENNSDKCQVYRNVFRTTKPAKDAGTGNIWYDNKISKGNYWSGFEAPDADNDGVLDKPYTQNGVNDLFPLAKEPGSKEKAKENAPPQDR